MLCVARNEAVRLRPASTSLLKVLLIGSLSAPSWAPSKLVVPIEATTSATDPGTVAQWVAPENRRRRPMRRSRTSKAESWENMLK